MFYTNSHDQIIAQAGTTQVADINTSIPYHLLQKAVMTNCKESNLPTRSQGAHKDTSNWLHSLVTRLVGKIERPYRNAAPAAH